MADGREDSKVSARELSSSIVMLVSVAVVVVAHLASVAEVVPLVVLVVEISAALVASAPENWLTKLAESSEVFI
jgi:hypothetical protein